MSRHRNVRSMNYDEEYYDEDDYGHSVEDNYCISPGTAAQFTYNRDRNVALSNFMDEQGGIPEEDEGEDVDDGTPCERHRSSQDYARPKLTDIEEAKLNSVLEEVRNVLGDTVHEGLMVDTIIRHNFSVEGSLNELLTLQEAPKPQREPRRDRRNRSQELDEESYSESSDSPIQDNVFSNIPFDSGGLMKFGGSFSPQSPSNLLESKENHKKPSSPKAHVIVSRQCAQKPLAQKYYNKLSDCRNGDLVSENLFDLKTSIPGQLPNLESKENSDFLFNGNTLSSDKVGDIKMTGQFVEKETSGIASSGISGGTHVAANKESMIQSRIDRDDAVETNRNTDLKNEYLVMTSCTSLNKVDSGQNMTLQAGDTQQTNFQPSLADLANAQGGNSKSGTSPTSGLDKSPLSSLASGHSSVESANSPIPLTSALSLSQLSGGGTLSNSPKFSTSFSMGMSLSKLANEKLVAVSSSSSPSFQGSVSLSQLAGEYGLQKLSPQTNQFQSTNSLSSLPASSPLSALAETQNSLSSSPSLSLSQLAQMSGVKKSRPFNHPPSPSTSANLSVGLSGKPQTGGWDLSSVVSSLSKLTATHGIKKAGPTGNADSFSALDKLGSSSSSQTVQSTIAPPSSGLSKLGPSLSQLAEAHGVKKPTSDCKSMTETGEDNKENVESGPIKLGSVFSSEMFKNKSDKSQIMLSLSNTVVKHEGEIIVRRQCATVPVKRDTERGLVEDIKKDRVDIEENDKVGNVKVNLTLADLAKGRSPKVMKGDKTDLRTIKTTKINKDNEKSEMKNEANKEKTKAVFVTENTDEELENKLPIMEEIETKNVKQLVGGPSNVGNTLCLEINAKEKVQKKMKYRMKKFSYKHQVKGVKALKSYDMTKIKIFDFCTPSPDDIVKAKQKQAFNRSGK